MSLKPAVSAKELDALQRFDTCAISNAIETFDVRLRNAGFADASIACMFKDMPPMVGYAATARLRSGDPPIVGRYHDRSEWWHSILEAPIPRIVVLQDLDEPAGVGALLGDVHAAILRALGCVGFVTNGAIRELPRVKELGMHVFAGNVAVSHAYAHIFDFGATVKVGGLEVNPGDLLHGDQHGLLSVPTEIAGQIPPIAEKLSQSEKKIVDFCRSPEFSLDKLPQVVKGLD
jgi:4-hydroxy-4-methyl-2-oxoglutarate aldolase